MFHYTYRITNMRLNKYYYGVRSSKIAPKKDIGVKYFSSSTDKEFIKDQKENPQDYKYKVIRISNTRKEAELLETRLHEKFQVQIHESFYNKAINTKMGFSVYGRKQNKEHIIKRFQNMRGKTLEEAYGVERANKMKENIKIGMRKRGLSWKKNISISRIGIKLSDEHKEAISKGIAKRYENEEFYKKFCKTMLKVNKEENKRKLASDKLKEKWKEPEYLEKMKARPHGSNSKSLKEKWADPVWREYMLEQRRIKRAQRNENKEN